MLRFILLILTSTILLSFPEYESQIPNGFVNSCLTCHVSSAWGSPRNQFGEDSGNNKSGAFINWAELASLDSDGDGFTNGEELQDPNGEFVTGNSNPGDMTLVTNPGNSESFPLSLQLELKGFSMFPNPTLDKVNVRFYNDSPNYFNFELYNLNGSKVQSLGSQYFSVSEVNLPLCLNLPAGQYYLVITSDAKTFSYPVTVQ